MRLETLVVCRFDTGPTFIDTDGPICHPPECHDQRVNVSSPIFAILSYEARARSIQGMGPVPGGAPDSGPGAGPGPGPGPGPTDTAAALLNIAAAVNLRICTSLL